MVILAAFFEVATKRAEDSCMVGECNLQPFDHYLRILAWISGTYYLVVAASWITQFIRFNIALRKVFEGTQIHPVSNFARWLFLVMVSGYTLPAIMRVVIRNDYLKVELELVSWPVFDFLAIIPNLLLHY